MRIISTRWHGLLDYLMGLFLAMSPWLLGFNGGGAKQWIPILLGASIIIYSVWTDYEWGAFKGLSMKQHLTLDLLGGLLLAVSPWLFGFADEVYLPHLILGVAEMGASLLTKTTPSRKGYLGPGTL